MLFLVNLLKKYKRRAVFIVFCSSLTSETLFFAFSAFRLRAKASFHRFSFFAHKRNTVFSRFWFSATAEAPVKHSLNSQQQRIATFLGRTI